MDRFQVGLEVALSGLLLITIFYSLYLGRALASIRRDRGELDALVTSLQASSVQAQSGIDRLRQTTEMVGRALGKTVETGKSLQQDLVLICERSEALAQRLEGGISAGLRVGDGVSPGGFSVPARREEERLASMGKGKSAAERELLRALRQKQG